MTDLARFLLDRIEENQTAASDLEPVDWFEAQRGFVDSATGPVLRAVTAVDATVDHVVRWDPARVLAECAAKRAIVTAWQRLQSGDTTEFVIGGGFDPLVGGALDAFGIAMRHLAGPYSDHPDFDASWAAGGDTP